MAKQHELSYRYLKIIALKAFLSYLRLTVSAEIEVASSSYHDSVDK